MLKLACVLSAGLVLGGVIFSDPAKAITVDYTLTFTGTGGTKADGTGTLVINETSPLNSFTENSLGDIVSLQVKLGGLTYNFSPNSFAADIGTNQTFYSLTGSSLGVTGPTGLTETLILGGSGFNITNPGGPNLDDGKFTIGPGVAATPLPPAWTMMLIGLAGFGFVAFRRNNKISRLALNAA